MKRILVVEDDSAIAFGLQVDLRSEGYDVEIASDGERALQLARRENFDLILLDVMLPRKDGFEVCRELRLGGTKTPIIMLTAKVQEAEKVMGLELGADDYVTKPFSPRELRARVKAALRRTVGDESQTYRFGDLEVDFARGELRRCGSPVELTALEYKLLTTFIRNRGRLLSRGQLLDLVWGHETFVTDRVVDNHVVALRKKIEQDRSRPLYLLSIRGMGYRFDA
ncbi:MAG: two component transcriptional regulator, winged helix family [Acidobacteria bacterium]|jgi:two-component system alkaline phosphatase synthesis response regulator PhoP|nr:two component transcriptional regulator, winged helix family [Acidobacteriota bacterium]